METRSASKRKAVNGAVDSAAEGVASPVSKRTRSATRSHPAPKPPLAPSARSTRSQRTKPSSKPSSKPTAADFAPAEPQGTSSRDQEGTNQDTQAAPANPGSTAGDMDRSGRRNSRGVDAPAGGADEERDAGDVFGRTFGATGSALQGLLRKLGAGFEEMLPLGVSGARIKGIIAGMKQFDDDSAQLSSLTELCELLSISTEESLSAFPVEQVVPLLVQLLGMEHNPDIMLLAARALTFMADVLPTSSSAIVRHGAVPALCTRLLTIEYIDLAEQSLQALEKLSHDHPQSLLQHGGLLAVLSYLDFFPTGVQRTAVATAATMCSRLGPSHASAVKDALPILCNLLQYQDAKVVDNACLALLHIAEAYAHDAALLEQLQAAGLINQALQLISVNDSSSSSSTGSSTQTSVCTYFGMVKVLSTCASGSAAVAQQLLKAGVVDTLRQLLGNCAMLTSGRGSSSGGTAPVLRTPDQLYEVMTLAHELLPTVPDASAMLLQDLPTHSSPAAEAARASSAAGQADVQAEFLRSEPEMVMNVCQSLLPLSLQVYSSTVVPNVRSRCLSTIVKLIAVASPPQLETVLAALPISSFVASLLGGRDVKAQAAAIQMAEILMAKLPNIFTGFFVKEGVAHALDQLAAGAPPDLQTCAAGVGKSSGAADAADGVAGSGPARRPSASGAGSSRADLPPPSPPVTRSRRTSKADQQGKDDVKDVAPAAPVPAAAVLDRVGPSGVDSLRTPSYSLRDAVARRAASFKQQHFQAGDVGAAGVESEGLRQLRDICERLHRDEHCVAALLEALTSSDVSVFEMITSGAVNCLTQFLQGQELPVDAQQDEQLLRRLRNFAAAALAPQDEPQGVPADAPEGPACTTVGGGAAAAAAVAATHVPLSALVRKLQAALSSAEAFPVLCSRLAPAGPGGGSSAAGRSFSRSAGMSGSFSSSSLTSGLAALTQPFKLRLVRHAEESLVKEYPANIVLIEPLANMTAIEDFLWPRVSHGNTVEALRARAAVEAAAAAAAAGSSRLATEAAGADGTKGMHGTSSAAAAGGSAAADGTGPSTNRRRCSPGATAAKPGSTAGAAARSSHHPASSKAQPIPDGPEHGSGRMTRAQAAKARAEAQARAEEAVNQRGRARRAAAAAGVPDPMSEDLEQDGSEDDLLMREHMSSDNEDEHMHDEGLDEEHEMDGAHEEGIFDHEGDDDDHEDDDMEDDGELDIGSMPVHDLHLAEGMAGAAATAAGGGSIGGKGSAASAGQLPGAPVAGGGATDGAAAAAESAAARAGAAGAVPSSGHAAGGSSAAGHGSRPPWGRSASGLSSAATAAGSNAAPSMARVLASAGPKLVFYMDGQRLAANSTVFQAIQQSTLNANSDAYDENGEPEAPSLVGTGRRGRQLWEQVYTLQYRLAGGEQAAAGSNNSRAGACSPGGSLGPAVASRQNSNRHGSALTAVADGDGDAGQVDHAGQASSQWRLSPLGELLTVQLSQGLAAPQSCLDILKLLQLLEVLNRLAPRLLASQELQLHADTPMGQTADDDGEAVGIAAVQSKAGQMALAHVGRDEFINSKLGNKLAQQLKDVLSICGGGIPAWCHQLVVSCKFLFPFEVRRRYFYSTAFGLGRALQHMHQQQAAEGVGGALERDGRELRIGRLQRQKVRVSRRRILDSAVKVMELYSKTRAVLELEYFGEVGTGLGPTLEFYTMLSHELQRESLGMWRHEESHQADEQQAAADKAAGAAAAAAAAGSGKSAVAATAATAAAAAVAGQAAAQQQVQLHQEVVSHEASGGAAEYVYAPHGLFPRPLPHEQRITGSAVVDRFRLLGRSIARALQDNRLLDLPLNPVFFRAALGKPLDLYDISQVDPALGSSLEKLAQAAAAHAGAGGEGDVLVDGCRVDDLCLTFTLPGMPSYELCPGGVDVMVDSGNLVQYIQGVVDATLGSGIDMQMNAFREGFNEAFSLSTLEVFREDEMELLLCGAGEHWSPQQLADSMKFDHGYTAQSTPVRHLLEILSELDTSDQRRFLRFVTGCPRLPPGGIAALQPRLTVVRKHPSLLPPSDGPTPGTTPNHNSFGDWSNGTPLADGDLPSVMTCANYIKLPPYSSKQVMRERILFAIREGQGSFDLS